MAWCPRSLGLVEVGIACPSSWHETINDDSASYETERRERIGFVRDAIDVLETPTTKAPAPSGTIVSGRCPARNWRPQGDSNPCYRRERAVS